MPTPIQAALIIACGLWIIHACRKAYRDPKNYRQIFSSPFDLIQGRPRLVRAGSVLGLFVGSVWILGGVLLLVPGLTPYTAATVLVAAIAVPLLIPRIPKPLPQLPPAPTPPGTAERAKRALQSFREAQLKRRP